MPDPAVSQLSQTVTDVSDCNVVTARDGVLVEHRPMTMCSHLRQTTWTDQVPPLHRESRMTPKGDWVWRMVGPWNFDADASEGRSIAENDAIQEEHHA